MLNDIRAPLEQICQRVDGTFAVTVMGLDGLPVDTVHHEHVPEGTDVASLLVEYSNLISQVKRSAQMFAAGGLEELSIRSENLTTIIRTINKDYFLAIALGNHGNFGKGRYMLRVNAPKLAEIL